MNSASKEHPADEEHPAVVKNAPLGAFLLFGEDLIGVAVEKSMWDSVRKVLRLRKHLFARKRFTAQVSMLLAALVLGILVSLQWSAGVARRAESSDQIDRTMRQLELEQEELKRTVGRLRERLDARQQKVLADIGTLEDLRAELTLQKMRAGLIDVRGSGVQIVLDDSRRTSGGWETSSAGSTNDFLIHDFDLRDVINVLWLAGAEAIAVNGERIVSSTSVYCVGSTIMVNDTRLSPPYQISAIGDSVQMQDYLRNPGYLGELKTRRTRVGLRVEFLSVEAMTIPAYRGSLPLRFAQPGS